MHCNTIVKARRSAPERTGPHHGATAHRDPEPHEILATSTTPTIPSVLTPVPSQHRHGAEHAHTPLGPCHPTRTRASRSTQQTGRTKTAPLPPPPLPSSSPFLPLSLGAPHPALPPSRVPLRSLTPRFLLPTLAVAGLSCPPDFASELVVPGVLFSSWRFAAPRLRRPRRSQAAERSRAGLLPRTSSLFGRWRPPPPSPLPPARSSGCRTWGWSGDPPGAWIAFVVLLALRWRWH